MDITELRSLCALLMCSDSPELEAESTILQKFADAECQRHGYAGWIDFHVGEEGVRKPE